MKIWQRCLIDVTEKCRKAVEVVDATAARIALVVEDGCLVGVVTDFDIRKALLCGIPLEQPVREMMNCHPTVMQEESTESDILHTMKRENRKQIPIVDAKGRVKDLRLFKDMIAESGPRFSLPVLLMAGGLGMRLRPLTDNCPKPLLKVGEKPILEIILENFIEAGAREFYISVNYKAEMIRDYFGNGQNYGVSITYIEETTRLGTAGALGLLPKTIDSPILVMNGDLLTKVDFHQLASFHRIQRADATMCVRESCYQIPYGVVKSKDFIMEDIQEKPMRMDFVNAGIYVLSPEVVKHVKENEHLDMTDLFLQLLKEKKRALVFPIREYWLDVGRMEDFNRAKEEFF